MLIFRGISKKERKSTTSTPKSFKFGHLDRWRRRRAKLQTASHFKLWSVILPFSLDQVQLPIIHSEENGSHATVRLEGRLNPHQILRRDIKRLPSPKHGSRKHGTNFPALFENVIEWRPLEGGVHGINSVHATPLFSDWSCQASTQLPSSQSQSEAE